MREWEDKFNSFNSWKGLLYAPWYQAIRDWKDGKRKAPLPPVEASLDPIQICQLHCSHCNASRYLENPPKNQIIRMSDKDLLNLIKFLGEWKVKAICFGGGGEPTLHTKLSEALFVTRQMGMDASVATNGVAFSDELIDAMAKCCRWVGVSVDAGSAATYKEGRGEDCYGKTLRNIKKLSAKIRELETNCDVAAKFLIFKYNQTEIYRACLIAKEIGAKDFHVRPADLSHQGMDKKYKGKAEPYNIDYIKKQFEQCHKLEDKNFHVYTIIHKFNDDFTPRKNFAQCYAAPCCIQLCSSGEVFFCPDQRYDEKYKLGEWYPNPENILNFWGSKKHYKLVFETGIKMCNTRCTFNPYCEQCERLFINTDDPMCKNFI